MYVLYTYLSFSLLFFALLLSFSLFRSLSLSLPTGWRSNDAIYLEGGFSLPVLLMELHVCRVHAMRGDDKSSAPSANNYFPDLVILCSNF
ncbi:hypothetical protein F5X99DRAFT_394099 [Biscogniauxia marginata]|nr:hypothetical protein F5X99DRAFT_394099 [Biscogniauxia marginata]